MFSSQLKHFCPCFNARPRVSRFTKHKVSTLYQWQNSCSQQMIYFFQYRLIMAINISLNIALLLQDRKKNLPMKCYKFWAFSSTIAASKCCTVARHCGSVLTDCSKMAWSIYIQSHVTEIPQTGPQCIAQNKDGGGHGQVSSNFQFLKYLWQERHAELMWSTVLMKYSEIFPKIRGIWDRKSVLQSMQGEDCTARWGSCFGAGWLWRYSPG